MTTEERRHGRVYNRKELTQNFRDIVEWTLESFEFNIQDLQTELDTDNKEINTEEIRSILKGMEFLCDELDDLPLLVRDKSK